MYNSFLHNSDCTCSKSLTGRFFQPEATVRPIAADSAAGQKSMAILEDSCSSSSVTRVSMTL